MVTQILALPITAPPSPWNLVTESAVGGLQAVGFAKNTDLLLVTSIQGRSVFNAVAGERIARDRSENFAVDAINLEAEGFGPLEGHTIRMAGIYGGSLSKVTSDGWQVEQLAIQWPLETLLLVAPGSCVYGASFGKNSDMAKVLVDSEIRAWGFSSTGRSLVLAISSGLQIYSRNG